MIGFDVLTNRFCILSCINCYSVARLKDCMYTVSQKKTGPILFKQNFGKFCPLLIILPLLHTEIICPQLRN